MPRFKLYHYPATRSARVKWLLHELLDEDFDVEKVLLYEGAQHRPGYLKKNPNHNVPTLEILFDDGSKMYMIESAAMITYLADAYPEKGLAPPANPTPARADYLQMLHFASTWIDMMLWQIRCHEHLLSQNERDVRTIDRYRKKFETEAKPQLMSRLEKTSHILGDEFSAADCIVGHDVVWARAYGLCQDPVFGAYVARLSSRPAFKLAFADIGEFKPEPPEGVQRSGAFTG